MSGYSAVLGLGALRLLLPPLLLSGVVVGCAQSPRVYRIVGPDGSPMLHVSCGSEQGQCYEVAGQSCPAGYELYPVLSPSSGNFLVRCRLPGPFTTYVAQRAGSPPTDGDWPPPNEPWQAESPWSTPEAPEAEPPGRKAAPASDGAPAESTPVSLRPIGEQDIGY